MQWDAQSGEKDYFGLQREIIELEYSGENKIVLFKCDWYDVYIEGRGIKHEGNGIITIDVVLRFLQTNEPYALASQVQQVYYVTDKLDVN